MISSNYVSKWKWKSSAAKRIIAKAGNALTMNEAVRKIVNKYLKNTSCPPTELEQLYKPLKIYSVEEREITGLGKVVKFKDEYKIFYSKQSHKQLRFTIAHEMGHIIMASTGPKFPRTGQELERICNLTASEILLPFGKVKKHFKNKINIDAILKFVDLFDVSLTTAIIKCNTIFDVLIFEVQNDTVVQNSKFIRKGYLKNVIYDSSLLEEIENAKRLKQGEAELYLNNKIWKGKWGLEWLHLGDQNKILFLLQPKIKKVKNKIIKAEDNSSLEFDFKASYKIPNNKIS